MSWFWSKFQRILQIPQIAKKSYETFGNSVIKLVDRKVVRIALGFENSLWENQLFFFLESSLFFDFTKAPIFRFNFIMGLLSKCNLHPKGILEVGGCVKSYEWMIFAFVSVLNQLLSTELLHSTEGFKIDAQPPTWILWHHEQLPK